MGTIGGYFELELNSKKHVLHEESLHLNTARNAFEYVLIANAYKKVFLPYYTCDVMMEPVKKLKLDYSFYQVNEQFEPLFDYGTIGKGEAFLYTNYFGLKDAFIANLAQKCKNLIIDNAQALFSAPLDGIDTFYSPRKFVGLPDGAFLYCNKEMDFELEQDISWSRMSHLLKRIDLGAEAGYPDFCYNDSSLENQPIKKMSNMTNALIASIDFELIEKKRKNNFAFLQHRLNSSNKLDLEILETSVPMVYPYWTNNPDLRDRLIANRIYTATYWPIVDQWCPSGLEHRLKNEIVHLPIDQRYDEKDLEKIIALIQLL